MCIVHSPDALNVYCCNLEFNPGQVIYAAKWVLFQPSKWCNRCSYINMTNNYYDMSLWNQIFLVFIKINHANDNPHIYPSYASLPESLS